MYSVNEILSFIKELPETEQDRLKTLLYDEVSGKIASLKLFVEEERFSNGRVCPHCGSISVVRNGHRKDGTQKYKCKDCQKIFVSTTNSVAAGIRKDMDVWRQFLACMVEGLSIRKTAEKCGIHRNTAFKWRHKLLDVMVAVSDNLTLDGIIEADESFFSLSYKGNHKNSKSFTMPRTPHKRGKSVHQRGLSKEQVCFPCAVNRDGIAIAKATNLGRVSSNDLVNAFSGKLKEDSFLVTDKMNAYVRFANDERLHLVQMKARKSVKGIYHIQYINNFHSQLKKFIGRFNGVSTKYLNNYLTWFGYLHYGNGSSEKRMDMLLSLTSIVFKTKTNITISQRPNLPFAC